MSMFCKNYGFELSEPAKFCPSCGQKIDNYPSTEESPPTLANTAVSGANISNDNFTSQEDNVSIPDKVIVQTFLKGTSRLNRLRYFKRMLVIGLVNYILIQVILNSINPLTLIAYLEYIPIIQIILMSPTIIIGYNLVLRRSHDIGHGDGLDKCYVAIPIIGCITSLLDFMLYATISIGLGLISIVMGLYLLFNRGEKGPNKYGPNPLS